MSKLRTLSSDKEFKYLFKNSRKLEDSLFKLWFARNDKFFSRFVFTVPVSVDKRSVVRNRLKRRAKEWVRKNFQNKNEKNLDIMLYFKKDTSKLTRKSFYEELNKIF